MRRRLLLAACPLLAAPAFALVDPPHPAGSRPVTADAALVLSGDVDFLRVREAAQLYAGGAVRHLLLTGSGIGGDSAVAMRREAVRAGVPPAAIRIEDRSTTTRENLVFARPTVRAEGWRRVALVTSSSHMGRALRAARRAMPDVAWVAVAVPDAGPARRVRLSRLLEWAKLAWYALRGWA